MVKTDRPNAPLGLGLLFLSLAIVPVSLRIAGYDVNVSPSLSAAVEAWRSVAGVLGTSSQSPGDAELALVKKYSFAPETIASAEQPVASEPCTEKFEAYSDPNQEPAYGAIKPETPSVVATAAIAISLAQTNRARTRLARVSPPSRSVVLDRWQRTLAFELPALFRGAARMDAKRAKCVEHEAGLLRVRELLRRSRALSESLKTIQLRENTAVFVKMRPIALCAGTMLSLSDGEQAEPAIEVFHGAGPRFGVGASEEPESEGPEADIPDAEIPNGFEYWLEF